MKVTSFETSLSLTSWVLLRVSWGVCSNIFRVLLCSYCASCNTASHCTLQKLFLHLTPGPMGPNWVNCNFYLFQSRPSLVKKPSQPARRTSVSLTSIMSSNASFSSTFSWLTSPRIKLFKPSPTSSVKSLIKSEGSGNFRNFVSTLVKEKSQSQTSQQDVVVNEEEPRAISLPRNKKIQNQVLF